MNVKAPLSKAAIAAAIASLSLTMLAPAASAAEAEISATVEAAERSMGIHDDSVDDEVVVLEGGEMATLEGSTQDLEVTVGDSSDASSEVTYTTDTLGEDTVRLASVLESAEFSTPSWEFEGDNTLILLNDGRVSVSDAEGNLVAGIETPWAVDANGKQLETFYSVEGTKLVQNVSLTDDTTFPVVADPKLSIFPGYTTITFNRSESFTVVGTYGTCAALLSKAVHPVLRAASVVCAGTTAFSGAQLAGGKCIKVHFAGLPPMATWWPTFPRC